MSPLRDAVLRWFKPQTVRLQGIVTTIPDKQAWMAKARIPTEAEELEIRGVLEAQGIPVQEWGAVCAFADQIRRNVAEESIQGEASQQIIEGLAVLDYGAERFVKWPWPAVHDLTGAMAPGTVHITPCPSKGGKTTFMRSATELWAKQGERVYFGGFEMPAKMLRAMYAADEVGIDPGHVVTGQWLERPDRDVLRLQLREAFMRQEERGSHYTNIAYATETNVTPQAVGKMMHQAADWGAKVVILDHLENVSASVTANGFQNASSVCHLLVELAQKHNLIVIGTSQLNTKDKSNDLWRDHRPIRVENVAYGMVKMQVSTTMFGLYRPVKPTMDKLEKAQVEAREKSVYEMLTPGVTSINLMASRPYASRIGQRALVGWERGRIIDLPHNMALDAQAGEHGIRLGTKY